jgi:hypothetical protein
MNMLTAILAFFQVIPAITGGLSKWTEAYYNAKVQITKARVGGDERVARQLVTGVVAEGQTRVEFLKAVGQSKFLMFLVGGFAIPWMVYQAKVVLYDNVIVPLFFTCARPDAWGQCYGYTAPIGGTVGEWAGVIIAGIFGTGSVMAVGQMFFNRRERS